MSFTSNRTDGLRWRTHIVPVVLGGDSYRRAHEACHIAAGLWNQAVIWTRDQWDNGNHTLNKIDIQSFLTGLDRSTRPLHAHTTEMIAHDLFDAITTSRSNRKAGIRTRAPWRHKNYRPLAFSARNGWRINKAGRLNLSLGRGRPGIVLPHPVVIDPTTSQPVPPADWGEIQLCWDQDGRVWSLHIACRTPRAPALDPDKTVAIDEGIINPMTLAAYDTTSPPESPPTIDVLVINGREGRAIKRERNKTVGQLARAMSKTKHGSRRHKRLARAAKKARHRANTQLKDFDHQVSCKAARFITDHDTGNIIAGDVRGIEQRTKAKRRASRSTRQQLSQWSRGRQEDYLNHKTGCDLTHIDESYSTQTCPACLTRNRPSGRRYRCRTCDFQCHRDAVGAINILMRATHGNYTRIDPNTNIRVTYLRAVPRWSPNQKDKHSARSKATNQATVTRATAHPPAPVTTTGPLTGKAA